MNKSIYIIACLLSIGCKENMQEPITGANAPKASPIVQAPTPNKPGFGECVDSAGTFVWDESAKVYHHLTSDEAKKAYSETWQSAKDHANSAYDSAMNAYHNWQNEQDSDKKTETPSEP